VKVDCVNVLQDLLDTGVPAVGRQVSKTRGFTICNGTGTGTGSGTGTGTLPKRLFVPPLIDLKKRTPLEHLSFFRSVITP
jgi:hypothetical protein